MAVDTGGWRLGLSEPVLPPSPRPERVVRLLEDAIFPGLLVVAGLTPVQSRAEPLRLVAGLARPAVFATCFKVSKGA